MYRDVKSQLRNEFTSGGIMRGENFKYVKFSIYLSLLEKSTHKNSPSKFAVLFWKSLKFNFEIPDQFLKQIYQKIRINCNSHGNTPC